MQKIGHRGAKGYVPENTIASFEKAIDLNVDGIELDVHLSADNQVMVIHDETIDRTTTKTGKVKDWTASELQKLGIPTLEEVIQLVNQRCFINIEIKNKKATKKVIQLIEDAILNLGWNYNLFQVSSFDWNVLETIAQLNPSISLGVLTEKLTSEVFEFAKKINAFSINPFFELIDQETVALWQQNGFKVFPWTVNNEEDIKFVKSLYVKGIISDFPDRI
ncbi:MAG: glycerophosphodiester phosphodiesterase [Flavobacterium sp.]|nr:glycerophosphodiester phosphodiesterase [Flavobacterium sp.]